MAITAYSDLPTLLIYDARKGVQGDRVQTTITAISQAVDATITSAAHGLTAGDAVTFAGCNCSPTLSGAKVVGTVVDANNFRLNPAFDTSAGAAGTFGLVQGTPSSAFLPALDGREVSKWNCQVSGAGAGANLIQATKNKQPTYFGGTRHGLGPGVNFLPSTNDTGVNANLGHVAIGGAVQVLRGPSSINPGAMTMGAFSALAVITPFNSSEGSDPAAAATADIFAALISISTANYQGVGIWKNKLCVYSSVAKASGSNLPNHATTPLPIIDSGLYVPNTPCVIAVSCGATSVTFRVNGRSVTLPNTFAADTNSSDVFALGAADTGVHCFWGKIHQVITDDSEWTSTHLDDGVAFAAVDWGLNLNPRLNMVYIGDSITSGKYASGMNGAGSWAHFLDALISPRGCGHSSFNMAVASKTAVLTDTEYATRIDPVFRDSMDNIAVIMLGINDLHNTSAATVAAAIFSVCDKARASGARKVVLCGILPGVTVAGAAAGEDATEVVRLAVNALLAASWASHADAYVPTDGLVTATIEFTTQKLRLHGDTSIMLSEGTAFVHPQAVLQEQIARLIFAEIQPWISSVGGVAVFGTFVPESRFFR